MKKEYRKLLNSFKKATEKMEQEINKDSISVTICRDYVFFVDCSCLWGKHPIFGICKKVSADGCEEDQYTNKNVFLRQLEKDGISITF